MKRFVFLFALLSLAIPNLAQAQRSTGSDEICIFWSEDCDDCQTGLTLDVGAATAYVVLMNSTSPEGAINVGGGI